MVQSRLPNKSYVSEALFRSASAEERYCVSSSRLTKEALVAGEIRVDMALMGKGKAEAVQGGTVVLTG